MDTADMILWGLAGVLVLGLAGVFFLWRGRGKLANVKKLVAQIENTQNLDPAHGVLECHKIFINGISGVAGGNTAAEKIKSIQGQLPNAEKIWRINRLRNQVAHESHIQVNSAQFWAVRADLIRALKALG